ncbi:hypothetical protein ROZALSC1DRAFT_30194 [Rozella allomycis CSF55]|uniref:Ubiquitin-activating enzyme E1-like n=1 Tax=Rozella allomycis (strain CSF55) TaxID=988480 RepID=A0A4P9YIE2_ROZAC|nr:hypothetical protein ROZALSC1DRAFT_30194 [Rozella allomycis CSF55]
MQNKKYSHLDILFTETDKIKLSELKVLLVGAGGIGCEVLKNLVLLGIPFIDVIDLDTIDISNLNRQFLFQKPHVGKPKSIVARESVRRFNDDENIVITSYMQKIQEFNVEFFERFDIVINALDNADARSYVNKMCLFTGKPLIETGTAGHLGQTTCHFSGVQCFDCEPREAQKTFPVCTIRSTPSAPIHCIVWAKNFLFPKLFQKLEEENDNDENSEDKESRKNEEDGYKKLLNERNNKEFEKMILKKVYKDDIIKLASLEKLWKGKKKPQPISSFDAKQPSNDSQKVWSLEENVFVFLKSVKNLNERFLDGQELFFDKDDEDAMEFVTSASNLRSIVFEIQTKSLFQAKSMAGNIIPAIATSNAMVSSLAIISLIKLLKNEKSKLGTTFLSPHPLPKVPRLLTHCKTLSRPDPNCSFCSANRAITKVDTNETNLNSFINLIASSFEFEAEEATVMIDGRLLFDPDFDDNLEKSLNSLGIKDASIVVVSTENEEQHPIYISIVHSQADQPMIYNIVKAANLKKRKAESESDDSDREIDAKKIKSVEVIADQDFVLIE